MLYGNICLVLGGLVTMTMMSKNGIPWTPTGATSRTALMESPYCPYSLRRRRRVSIHWLLADKTKPRLRARA
jgi:hypothetical protein